MRPRAWLALAALAACVALTAWMAVGSLRSRGPVVPLRVALRIENGLDDTVTVEADARAWLEIERPSDPASRWEGYGVIDPAGTSSPGTGAGNCAVAAPGSDSTASARISADFLMPVWNTDLSLSNRKTGTDHIGDARRERRGREERALESRLSRERVAA